MPERILNSAVKYDGVLYEKDTVVDFPQEIIDALPEGTCRDVPKPTRVVRAPRAANKPAIPPGPPPVPPAPPAPTASTEEKAPEAGLTADTPAASSEEAPAAPAEEPAAPVTTG